MEVEDVYWCCGEIVEYSHGGVNDIARRVSPVSISVVHRQTKMYYY